MKDKKISNVPRPFTFHIQVAQTFTSQIEVEDFRNFFSNPLVREAMTAFGKIHFARTVLIPMSRNAATAEGTFAFQVMIVYDGEWEAFLQFLWDTAPLRNLFQRASGFAKMPGFNVGQFSGFAQFVEANNITRKPRELHKGYARSVNEIRQAFGQ